MMFGGIKSFCAALVCAALAGTTSVADEGMVETEFAAEKAALIAATTAFFDQVETNTPRLKKMPVIGAPTLATKISTVSASETERLTEKGPVDHLTAYRITWYPVERLLGSVDFMGTWDNNRSLVCGYLTWDVTDPDTPKLQQVKASFVELADLASASEQDIHQSLLEANCAFGAIEANFHLFDVAG